MDTRSLLIGLKTPCRLNLCGVYIDQCVGRVSLARENEAGGSWGQEVHIRHVNE